MNKQHIVSNAFSINMLNGSCDVNFRKLELSEAANLLRQQTFVSAIGHADTAMVFSQVIGHEIAMNRTTVQLDPEDVLLVGQYKGPRLPEGCSTLPDGATIEWWLVTVL